MTQTTPTRTRRTAEEWTQLMARYEQSGLGQRQFCRQQGLGYSTFCKWKQRLAARRPQEDLIELTPSAEDSGSASYWDIELTLGAGMMLKIRRG